jgi:hypothetical protein
MATPKQTTLLALIQTISEYATTDEEIVATVVHLINSRTVVLCGTFAGARIDLSAEAAAVPRSSSASRAFRICQKKASGLGTALS